MSTILENLKIYFKNNSLEQIKKDWAELEEYDNIGPNVFDLIKQTELFTLEQHKFKCEYIYAEDKVKNPKFTSDFFFNLVSH